MIAVTSKDLITCASNNIHCGRELGTCQFLVNVSQSVNPKIICQNKLPFTHKFSFYFNTPKKLNKKPKGDFITSHSSARTRAQPRSDCILSVQLHFDVTTIVTAGQSRSFVSFWC